MSETTAVPVNGGVIHDIGYQRYDGPRLGRLYAVRSLYTFGVRTAFGLGRSGKAKVFPWAIVGLLMMVAIVLTVIRSQSGQAVTTYWGFIPPVVVLVVLFVAIVAPELVSRDLRGGVLPLYFSRPLTRLDYPLAKLAAIISATFLVIAAPLTLMFVGGAFTLDIGAVWNEFGRYTAGLAAAAAFAIVFGSLALLIASLAGRRAVAAAAVVGVFLITTPIWAVLQGIAYSSANQNAGPDGEPGLLTGSALKLANLGGLVSPVTLVNGVDQWLFGVPDNNIGTYGAVYALVALALAVVSILFLLLRYRKVAR